MGDVYVGWRSLFAEPLIFQARFCGVKGARDGGAVHFIFDMWSLLFVDYFRS